MKTKNQFNLKQFVLIALVASSLTLMSFNEIRVNGLSEKNVSYSQNAATLTEIFTQPF
jgi:hypothetical protein